MELTLENSFRNRKKAAMTQNYGFLIRFESGSILSDLTGFLFDYEAFRDVPELAKENVLPDEHVYPQIILSPHPLPGTVKRYFEKPDDPDFIGMYDQIVTASNYWYREAFISGGYGLEKHDFYVKDIRKNIFMEDILCLKRLSYIRSGLSRRHFFSSAATLFVNPFLSGIPLAVLPKKKLGARYTMMLKDSREIVNFTSLKVPEAYIYAGQVLELYVGPPDILQNNRSEDKRSADKRSEDNNNEIEF